MGRKSIPSNSSICDDGVLFILTRISLSRGYGTDQRVRVRINSDVNQPYWTREVILLNNPGRKYTIGSGNDLENLDPEKYGQFLIFRNKADVAEEHCQIECDENGTFWLYSLGSANTFLNGKLIPDSPVMLKFGDIFHFSHIISQLWDSALIHLTKTGYRKRLYRMNKLGEEYAVFKFDKKPTNSYENKQPGQTFYQFSRLSKILN
ncbi:uncharacterized protein LOC118434090 [Folsomia candida]|uniref:uncharacterized protein LOC118434090 n=1 Tax=Folsomia candida TaxID=158441 RepID=UPI001604AFE0|nr:uncharacterized protein LOC118434090 [Folsomia candida]